MDKGLQERIQELIRQLGSVTTHDEALDELKRIGKPAVLALIKAWEREDEDVQWLAFEALGEIGDARALDALVDALKNEDAWVRDFAAGALRKIGEPAVPALIEALNDRNSDVRWHAAGTLGKIGDAQAVPPLIKTLKDKDPNVRERAALALGEIGELAFSAFNEAYMKGEIQHELTEIFYEALKLELSEEKFDKGTVAPPRERPKRTDDLERMWVMKARTRSRIHDRKLRRCVSNG